MPRRTRILFFIVSCYVLAAFGWWGYSLLRINYANLYKERLSLEAGAERLKIQLVDECLLAGRNVPGFAALQARLRVLNPRQNYQLFVALPLQPGMPEQELSRRIQVRPRSAEYQALTDKSRRKTLQYVSEGGVFIVLMVWGMVLLYRSIKSRFALAAQQNNFLLAVTHELKTPVAGIKLMLQSMERHGISVEAKQDMVQGSLHDVQRLETLVENVLMATRMDGGAYHFAMEPVQASQLLGAVVSAFDRSNQKQQKIVTQFAGDSRVNADPFALNIVFYNLLSNSVKYSPPGATIHIETHEYDGNLYLTITDEGPPIPESETGKVYRKFYRIGNEETRSSKGTGLGLYIVKRVLEQHAASIAILSRADKPGNIFEIRFPLSMA